MWPLHTVVSICFLRVFQIDLVSLINKAGCECLNEEDDHPLSHALTSKGGYLRSDCDEQLIIFISFNQAVKLHSLKIHGPPGVVLFH